MHRDITQTYRDSKTEPVLTFHFSKASLGQMTDAECMEARDRLADAIAKVHPRYASTVEAEFATQRVADVLANDCYLRMKFVMNHDSLRDHYTTYKQHRFWVQIPLSSIMNDDPFDGEEEAVYAVRDTFKGYSGDLQTLLPQVNDVKDLTPDVWDAWRYLIAMHMRIPIPQRKGFAIDVTDCNIFMHDGKINLCTEFAEREEDKPKKPFLTASDDLGRFPMTIRPRLSDWISNASGLFLMHSDEEPDRIGPYMLEGKQCTLRLACIHRVKCTFSGYRLRSYNGVFNLCPAYKVNYGDVANAKEEAQKKKAEEEAAKEEASGGGCEEEKKNVKEAPKAEDVKEAPKAGEKRKRITIHIDVGDDEDESSAKKVGRVH